MSNYPDWVNAFKGKGTSVKIENRLHWVLADALREYRCTAQQRLGNRKHWPAVPAALLTAITVTNNVCRCHTLRLFECLAAPVGSFHPLYTLVLPDPPNL